MEESGNQGSLFVATIVDPKEAKEREAGMGRRLAKRYTHKKVFTIRDALPQLNPFLITKCQQRLRVKVGIKDPAFVVKAEILPELSMFVVSQAFGVVSFYDLLTCELLSFMNQESWSPLIQQKLHKQVLAHNRHAFIDSDDDSTLGETAQQTHDEESFEI